MHNPIQDISNFLFLEDAVQKADIILVPGAIQPEQMEKACELYNLGYSSLILPSGGLNQKLTDYETEWDFFSHIAKKYNIPESNILIEKQAKNTFENARFSKKVIIEKGIQVETAILVCKSFHTRRALLTYQTEFGCNIKYIVIPINDCRDIRKDNWHTDIDKYKKVMIELEKIGNYFSNYIEVLRTVSGNEAVSN